jgi:hypothetical protein
MKLCIHSAWFLAYLSLQGQGAFVEVLEFIVYRSFGCFFYSLQNASGQQLLEGR